MEHLGKNILVNISIDTITRLPKTFLTEYFSASQISEMHDSLYEGTWMTLISNVDISRRDFYKFMLDLTSVQDCFNITLDSEQSNLNEDYVYMGGNDFITRKYVDDEYCKESGMKHLIGILFHGKEEQIKLKDMK